MIGIGYTLLIAFDSIAENSQYSNGEKTGLLSGSVVFGASIAYSRFFLGLHSIDQIIYGSVIGIWLAISLHYIFREDVMKHLNQILELVD